LLLVLVTIFYFVLSDPGQLVTLTILSEQITQPLPVVLLGAVAVGVAFMGVVAMIEGAKIRIENRRLKKEIQRLETQLELTRSQSPSSSGATPVAASAPPRPYEESAPVASAPVYGPSGSDRD
jgi:uncharacterized integral membrane protein